MDAFKLLLALSPWIAFWVISGGHTMLFEKAGLQSVRAFPPTFVLTYFHEGYVP